MQLAENGEREVENVPGMTGQQWEIVLKSRYRGRIERWTATYNVVVVRAA